MRKVQNTDASVALVRAFGLTGLIGLSLDEVIVPTADVGDFAGRSPWETWKRGADGQSSPAKAGEYSLYIVRPGVGTVLVVEEAYVVGAAGGLFLLNIFRPVDFAAMATNVSTSALPELVGRVLSTGFFPQLAATATIGSHTGTALGANIGRYRTSGTIMQRVAPPRGLAVLDGRDPAGLPGLGFINASVNQAFDVDVFVTEYSNASR